jgi:hypothetical protein
MLQQSYHILCVHAVEVVGLFCQMGGASIAAAVRRDQPAALCPAGVDRQYLLGAGPIAVDEQKGPAGADILVIQVHIWTL